MPTYPTLTLPARVGVSFNSTQDTTMRVNQANFGNGYMQITADGINNVVHQGNVSFSPLTRAEANSIISQLEGWQGYQPFWFTMPGEGSPKLWVCLKVSRTYVDRVIDGVSAQFMQVFRP